MQHDEAAARSPWFVTSPSSPAAARLESGAEGGARAECYLDHAAGSSLRPEARDALLAALRHGPGNPGSPHAAGRRARAVLEEARERLGEALGIEPRRVVFTSGTTEANRMALRGALAARQGSRPRLATCALAHPSTASLAERLTVEGACTSLAAPGLSLAAGDGPAGSLVAALPLVESVTGAVADAERAADALGGGAHLHVDAAQALGRVDVAPALWRAASVSLSSHKIGGPAGIAALVLAEGARWTPPDGTAAQERGRRPGTESPALAAGFAAAAAAAVRRPVDDGLLAPLLDLVKSVAGGELVTDRVGGGRGPSPRAAGIAAVRFAGCPGDALLAALDARCVRVSTGTACASGARTPAAVLLAAGLAAREAAETVRVSCGHDTTQDDVARLVQALELVVPHVRAAFA